MSNHPDGLANLASEITKAVNEAMIHGTADRGDAISALHIVLARLTRETEEMSRSPRPDIRS
jgi:ABC-type proline/glycine betaine transport system permease subunit